jgi:hypothetical protein
MPGQHLSPKSLEPISYREALLSTLLHVIVYIFTHFPKCTDWYRLQIQWNYKKEYMSLNNIGSIGSDVSYMAYAKVI